MGCPLGPVTSQAMGFLARFIVAGMNSFLCSWLSSNQKAVGYPHNFHATVVPVGMPCLAGLPCGLQGSPLSDRSMAFLPQFVCHWLVCLLVCFCLFSSYLWARCLYSFCFCWNSSAWDKSPETQQPHPDSFYGISHCRVQLQTPLPQLGLCSVGGSSCCVFC